MLPNDEFIILECALPSAMIVLVVVVKRLAEEVLRVMSAVSSSSMCESNADQAVQMMQSFNIRRISTAVFLSYLDLVVRDSGACCFVCGDANRSV
jgi:hypothetical protein